MELGSASCGCGDVGVGPARCGVSVSERAAIGNPVGRFPFFAC